MTKFSVLWLIKSKCGNTLQNGHLLSRFSSQNESDWFFLFDWISFSGKRDLSYEVATSSSPQLLQLIGTVTDKSGDHIFVGCSLPFSKERRAAHPFAPIQQLIGHTCKTQGAAVYHPPTLHRSRALQAMPEDPLCLNTSGLHWSASTHSSEIITSLWCLIKLK